MDTGSIVWDKTLNVWYCITCHEIWSSFDTDRPDVCDKCVEEDVVKEQFGCPHCGERRVDYLALEETEQGDVVQCISCHEYYTLPVFCVPDVDMRREDYYQAGLLPPTPPI